MRKNILAFVASFSLFVFSDLSDSYIPQMSEVKATTQSQPIKKQNKQPVGDNRLIHKAEIDCLAKIMYYEARGESKKGQLAVGMVAINRSNHSEFPDKICRVMRQDKQFSWYRHNPPINEKETYQEIREIAQSLYQQYHQKKTIPTGMATFKNATFFSVGGFNNPRLARVGQVGKHSFFRIRGET